VLQALELSRQARLPGTTAVVRLRTTGVPGMDVRSRLVERARAMHIRFADCELDTSARQLLRQSHAVHLSPKAFELLKTLVEERPRALSKQELLERVWPGVFVSDASLARAVSEIRDAIGDHSRSDGFLQTVHGFGYRFATAGVTVMPETEPASASCWLMGRDVEFRISDGEHIIGREPGVSIRLDSPKVSRHHARVIANGRAVSIEDLGSKNGTFVRGERVASPTELTSGDEVQIGPIKLVFRVDEGMGITQTEVWADDPG
jgi:DNA-binding winged helix-turn-helix (wHTH) protein